MNPTLPSHSWLLLLLLATSLVLGGCGPEAQGGVDGDTRPNRFISTYLVSDVDNSTYDITLFPGGGAISNKINSAGGVLGQTGHWIANDYRALIYFNDRTIVSIYGVGPGFRKYLYTSDQSVADDNPAHWSTATKVAPDRLPYVGVWASRELPSLSLHSGGLIGDSFEFTPGVTYYSIHSDGKAFKCLPDDLKDIKELKSSDPRAAGTWTVKNDSAVITWADGSSKLTPTVEGLSAEFYLPGVPTTQPSNRAVAWTCLKGSPTK